MEDIADFVKAIHVQLPYKRGDVGVFKIMTRKRAGRMLSVREEKRSMRKENGRLTKGLWKIQKSETSRSCRLYWTRILSVGCWDPQAYYRSRVSRENE